MSADIAQHFNQMSNSFCSIFFVQLMILLRMLLVDFGEHFTFTATVAAALAII